MPKKWTAPHSSTSPAGSFPSSDFPSNRPNPSPSQIISPGTIHSLRLPNAIGRVLLSRTTWTMQIVTNKPPRRMLVPHSKLLSANSHYLLICIRTGLCSLSNLNSLLYMGFPSVFFLHTTIVKSNIYTTLTTFSITVSDLRDLRGSCDLLNQQIKLC